MLFALLFMVVYISSQLKLGSIREDISTNFEYQIGIKCMYDLLFATHCKWSMEPKLQRVAMIKPHMQSGTNLVVKFCMHIIISQGKERIVLRFVEGVE